MRLAIFADVHGRVDLCFALCQRWEQETGQRLDYLLQAGDLGAFFDLAHLDQATIRHAQRDPTELGFLHHFASATAMTAALLQTTTAPMLFVRGNHEDHAVLDQLEQQSSGSAFPIDAYQRIWCLKTGCIYHCRTADATLALLGIGRIGPISGEHAITQAKYIQLYEQERIYALGGGPIDVLLTHDSARNAVTTGYGMTEISDVLAAYRPAYHFYGHTGEPMTHRLDANGVTHVYTLADLKWEPDTEGRLPAGVMAILTWHSRTDTQVEIVDAPWLAEYRRPVWLARYLRRGPHPAGNRRTR